MKFPPLYSRELRRFCETHRVNSPLPTRFFPYARDTNRTIDYMFKEHKSLTIWTNPFRTYSIGKLSKTLIPSRHLPHKVKNS